jgi:hypothetical protein
MTAIPAEYDAWIDAATAHLHGALDTARDELERDHDFLDEELPPSPPSGPARDACIRAALRRLYADLADLQE